MSGPEAGAARGEDIFVGAGDGLLWYPYPDYDEKKHYVAYFRQPDFKTFSKYLSAASSNNAVAMRTLAKDCFLAGDEEMIKDDSLFLFGTMGQLSRIIEMRNGRLVNLSKTRK